MLPAWTPETIEELTRRWHKNETAREIALALGVSRNAVIGKAHRLGLESRKLYARQGEAEATREARLARRNERERARRSKYGFDFKVVHNPDPKPAPRPNYSALRCVEVEPLHLALDDLRMPITQCRWPYGDDPATVTYCGHPTLTGKSYCGPHAAQCLLPVQPRAARVRVDANGRVR